MSLTVLYFPVSNHRSGKWVKRIITTWCAWNHLIFNLNPFQGIAEPIPWFPLGVRGSVLTNANRRPPWTSSGAGQFDLSSSACMVQHVVCWVLYDMISLVEVMKASLKPRFNFHRLSRHTSSQIWIG
jgi:hypothetical protein